MSENDKPQRDTETEKNPFLFHKGPDERVHASESLMSLSGFAPQEAERNRKDEEHHTEEKRTKQAIYAIIQRLETDALKQRLADLKARALEIEQEIARGEATLERLREEALALARYKSSLFENLAELDRLLKDTTGKHSAAVANAEKTAKAFEDYLARVKKEDPATYKAYEDYRQAAIDLITIEVKLPGDAEGTAPPVVFKDEKGEYFVRNSKGEAFYVKDMDGADELFARIKDQLDGKGRLVSPDDPAVKAWQDKFHAFYNPASEMGKILLRTHEAKEVVRKEVDKCAQEIEKLTQEQNRLQLEMEEVKLAEQENRRQQENEQAKLDALYEEQAENRVEQAAVKARLVELTAEAGDIALKEEALKRQLARIETSLEEKEAAFAAKTTLSTTQQKIFDYVEANKSKTKTELIRDIPKEIKAELRTEIPQFASIIKTPESGAEQDVFTAAYDYIAEGASQTGSYLYAQASSFAAQAAEMLPDIDVSTEDFTAGASVLMHEVSSFASKYFTLDSISTSVSSFFFGEEEAPAAPEIKSLEGVSLDPEKNKFSLNATFGSKANGETTIPYAPGADKISYKLPIPGGK